MSNTHQETEQVQETEFGGPPLHKQKKTIHFSNGETLEMEDSEEEEEDEGSTNRTPFRGPSEKTRLSFKNVAIRVGRISLMVCDFLGERLAGVLGLTAAKYQYAIDHYSREHKTSGDHLQGQPETTHLSPGLSGSQYKAAGDVSRPSEPQESHNEKHANRNEGRHNRGYQTDEDGWKSN